MSRMNDYAIEIEESGNNDDVDFDYWDSQMDLDERAIIAVEEICSPIDEDDVFFEHGQQVFGEVEICGVTRDAIAVLAETDEDTYDEMKKEFITERVSSGNWVEVGCFYYDKNEVLEVVDNLDNDMFDLDPYHAIAQNNALAA